MNDNEMFPIVDENGNIIGAASRKECHSGVKILHPVVHLHIIDEKGNLLLQKRSMNKDIQPGKWDTAVGGHVDLGENIFGALQREAKEELGIEAKEAKHVESYVFESEIEKELINTFVLKVKNPDELSLTVDPKEIDEVKFWSSTEIEDAFGKGVLTANFEMEFNRLYSQLCH